MFKNNIEINSFPVKNPMIVLSQVSKNFGVQKIFSDIDMVVNQKDRIAIIGPNGTGKSTLLKIIIGLFEPDGGEISFNKNLRVGYLPQETNWSSLENKIIVEMKSADKEIFELIQKKLEYESLLSDASMKDLKEKVSEYGEITHRYEARKGYEYEKLAEDLLKEFNFREEDWERSVKSLSGGERTRLALAKIILCRPNILVMDEPTNHLDLQTIGWLEGFLSGWQMAVIVVSHDSHFLDTVCDKTYELSKDGLDKYYCNFSQYLLERAKRIEEKEESYKRQEKYLAGQERFIERFRYKATKARAVQSRIKLLGKMEKMEEPEKDKKKIKIRFKESGSLPQKVLEIKDLVVGEKNCPLVMLVGEWEVEKDQKIGIIGANGAGKSTFLKTLIGKNKVMEGEIKFSPRVKFGYYAQAHEDLDPRKDILNEVKFKTGAAEEKIRSVLGSLLFSGEDAFKLVNDLSGGERARVAIAELILNDSNMLLLDEPTNHLDISSKEAVAEVLKNFSGPIIMVSHDRSVLNKVCNIIWEIKDNEIRKYLGNYDDYKHKERIDLESK